MPTPSWKYIYAKAHKPTKKSKQKYAKKIGTRKKCARYFKRKRERKKRRTKPYPSNGMPKVGNFLNLNRVQNEWAKF